MMIVLPYRKENQNDILHCSQSDVQWGAMPAPGRFHRIRGRRGQNCSRQLRDDVPVGRRNAGHSGFLHEGASSRLRLCIGKRGGFFLTYYRDYQVSKFWASYSDRSEAVTSGGVTTQRLRFISTNDSRLTTLQGALLTIGLPVSGLVDSYKLGAGITKLNTALSNAKVYAAVWPKP